MSCGTFRARRGRRGHVSGAHAAARVAAAPDLGDPILTNPQTM
jgi:hypothetical protein